MKCLKIKQHLYNILHQLDEIVHFTKSYPTFEMETVFFPLSVIIIINIILYL